MDWSPRLYTYNANLKLHFILFLNSNKVSELFLKYFRNILQLEHTFFPQSLLIQLERCNKTYLVIFLLQCTGKINHIARNISHITISCTQKANKMKIQNNGCELLRQARLEVPSLIYPTWGNTEFYAHGLGPNLAGSPIKQNGWALPPCSTKGRTKWFGSISHIYM